MTEQEIERVRTQVRMWGPTQVAAGLEELYLRRRDQDRLRRRLAWAGATGAAGLTAVVAFIALGHLTGVPTRPAMSARSNDPRSSGRPAPGATTLALDEGSEVTFDRQSQVTVTERSARRIVVAVRTGAARFKVRHDRNRVFHVDAGAVQIDDLGTTFRVERQAGRVRVAVSEGRVDVSFPGTTGASTRVSLGAGETGVYPPPETAPDSPAAAEAPVPAPTKRDSWRALAHAGDYAAAFRVLARDGFRSVRDEPTDLLLAADVARLSRHPSASVAPLGGLVKRHATDARAPAAAFTLGWVLMNDLRRPREAAAAFAQAERLAPRGNLAEDAIARAAEAWYEAGDLTRAEQEVNRYARAYPQGRHQALLERLIGAP